MNKKILSIISGGAFILAKYKNYCGFSLSLIYNYNKNKGVCYVSKFLL